MKSLIRRLTTLTALTATALGASAIASTSALAQNYGEQAIAADRAVAVAEPVANGRFYRLLIIEQLSDRRACYEEQPGSPTVIDPLLLNFDFSGICGRSSDSNGYSVRIGNEDLSRQYRLQITRRGDNLVLVALPGALPGRANLTCSTRRVPSVRRSSQVSDKRSRSVAGISTISVKETSARQVWMAWF